VSKLIIIINYLKFVLLQLLSNVSSLADAETTVGEGGAVPSIPNDK